MKPADKDDEPIKKAPDGVALWATGVTLAGHLGLTAAGLGPSPFFIGGACLFWALFVFARARRDPGIGREWGFRTDNLPKAAAPPAGLLLLGAGALGLFAHLQGTLRFPLHTLILFLLYPVWGVIQQFLTLGIVVGNMERMRWLGDRKALIIFIGAVLFGLVHAYDLKLALATFLLELLLIPLFLLNRNVWPLGFLHGWLGGLFYLWVLNEDLWIKIFGE